MWNKVSHLSHLNKFTILIFYRNYTEMLIWQVNILIKNKMELLNLTLQQFNT